MDKLFPDARVLTVDDDEDILAMLRYALSAMGIRYIAQKQTGEAALSFIKENAGELDLVICDWNMPEPTGIEVLASTKDKAFSAKFLMLTGRKRKGNVIAAKKAGVDAYMVKPFTIDELKKKITALLTKKIKEKSQ